MGENLLFLCKQTAWCRLLHHQRITVILYFALLFACTVWVFALCVGVLAVSGMGYNGQGGCHEGQEREARA